MTGIMETDERYTVISADCHGGGAITDYRDYLPSGLHDDFDTWLETFVNPYEDLEDDSAAANWDSARRLGEMDEDGIVGEVIFPNTIPPFFPRASLTSQPPAQNAGDLELRWAGLQAHNRWLVDFCNETPGRRAGVVQIMLHDIDAAVEEIIWAREAGLTGGVLLPGAPPGIGLPPLYDPVYEPLWAVCEETGMPVNHHGGSGAPPMGPTDEDHVIFLLEVTWWAHRVLAHLIVSGALERHPDLQIVLTEQGTAWVPAELQRLDYYFDRMGGAGGSQEQVWGRSVVEKLSLKPSEYWARQCQLGSSFIRPHEVRMRDVVGVDRIMWGSDYPHREGSHPYSLEALRVSFAGVDQAETAAMLGGNAAELYGFDLDLLAPIAAEIGPRVADVAEPLAVEDIPTAAFKCPAFAGLTPSGTAPTDQENR